MSRVFIIHGYGGRPDQGWKPWLKSALEKRGYEVVAPALPDTDHPRAPAWVEAIRAVVGEPRPDDAFVAHSLGCIATVRYLETLPAGSRVGRAIFLAGFHRELGDEYAEIKSFLDAPVDWETAKAACPSFTVIQSDDDDAVPVERAREFAEMLGVTMEIHTGYGHFTSGDGVTELPLLLAKFD